MQLARGSAETGPHVSRETMPCTIDSTRRPASQPAGLLSGERRPCRRAPHPCRKVTHSPSLVLEAASGRNLCPPPPLATRTAHVSSPAVFVGRWPGEGTSGRRMVGDGCTVEPPKLSAIAQSSGCLSGRVSRETRATYFRCRACSRPPLDMSHSASGQSTDRP